MVALVDVGPLRSAAPSSASPGSTGEGATPAEVFEQFRPPFDLRADMLLAVALCPTAPLLERFPGVPFLSVLGRTPLIVWFSQITEALYRDTAGRVRSA